MIRWRKASKRLEYPAGPARKIFGLLAMFVIVSGNAQAQENTNSEVSMVEARKLDDLITKEDDDSKRGSLEDLRNMQNDFQELYDSIVSTNDDFKMLKKKSSLFKAKFQEAIKLQALCERDRLNLFDLRDSMKEPLSNFAKNRLAKMDERVQRCFKNEKSLKMVMFKEMQSATSELAEMEEWENMLPTEQEALEILGIRIRQRIKLLDIEDAISSDEQNLENLREVPTD